MQIQLLQVRTEERKHLYLIILTGASVEESKRVLLKMEIGGLQCSLGHLPTLMGSL